MWKPTPAFQVVAGRRRQEPHETSGGIIAVLPEGSRGMVMFQIREGFCRNQKSSDSRLPFHRMIF